MEQASKSQGVMQGEAANKLKQETISPFDAASSKQTLPQEKALKVQIEQDVDKFEEYKLFVEDTARFSDRRQTVTYIYATINGAIVGLATFLFQAAGFSSWRIVIILLPLILAGGFICYAWYRLLSSYKKLLRFRFKQLEQMEDALPGCHRMYNLEADYLYSNAPKREKIEQTRIEMWLPWLFIVIYMAIPLLAIILVASNLR
jgi:hypothetical protein